MKILLVCPEYPPENIGGGGIVYQNLAENYKRLGHDVVIIYGTHTSKYLFDKISVKIKNNIKIIKVPEIKYWSKYPFMRTAMPPNLEFLNLEGLIKLERPDVAHVHGYGLIFIDLVAFLLRKLGIPYIFTLHGVPQTPVESGRLLMFVWGQYKSYIGKKTLSGAKTITCVSDFLCQNEVLKEFTDKTVRIYNGLNVGNSHVKKIDLRTKYGLPKNSVVFFSIGRVSKSKGFQKVIRRLNKYKKKINKEIFYLIAGEDDGYLYNLNKLVKSKNLEKQVIFLGKISENDKNENIANCDYFFVPSEAEPFGLVVLEGISLGKSPIVSRGGSFYELSKIFTLNFLENFDKKNNSNLNRTKLRKFRWKHISRQYIELLESIR